MGQKQEGNGMNRRPVLGSKTAEGLRSFKYSLLQCPKTTKIGSSWRTKNRDIFTFFKHSFKCKISKTKKVKPFADIDFLQQMSQRQ